jgi:2'-hydroxyisoflavone reductase
MRILVLGGTRFVGLHLVEAARSCGHAVTVFNRGRTPLPWADVEQLTGDRETDDLESLRGRAWDACIDVSGYRPEVVRASAGLLRDRVESYAFISTVSVYALPAEPPIDETGALARMPAEGAGDGPGLYGPLKVACEHEVETAFPGRCLILRPGIVAGPHDPTNRFAWWVERAARGGAMLAPGGPETPLQLVDGRDLARFAVALIGARAAGVYNVCGDPSSFGELIAACTAATGGTARPVWVSEATLLAEGVEPFSELPLWIGEDPEARGFYAFGNARARAAGLSLRPLEDTARDTWEWIASVRAGTAPEPVRGTFVARGLSPERERAIIRSSHNA